MNTYVITGATGNTGKPIALGLLEHGHKVRVISRSAEKAKDLTDKGAVLFQGDTTNKDLLVRAFRGADAVYAMIPFDAAANDYTTMQENHGRTIAAAIRETGVKNVVLLSSIGAHLSEGAGVVQGLERTEKMLNSIPGLNAIYLRAGYFMENTLGQVGAIKHMGAMASPVRGDLRLPMVATRDIAGVALNYLLSLDFEGIAHEYVLGQRDVSYNEIARIFGNAVGLENLNYITVSPEDGIGAMMQMGLGASVSGKLMEFVQAVNDGRALEDAHRAHENTTRTSIEDFAATFARIYNGQQG